MEPAPSAVIRGISFVEIGAVVPHLLKRHGKDATVEVRSRSTIIDEAQASILLTTDYDFVILPLTMLNFGAVRLAEMAHILGSPTRIILNSSTELPEEVLLGLFDAFIRAPIGDIEAFFPAVITAVGRSTKDLDHRVTAVLKADCFGGRHGGGTTLDVYRSVTTRSITQRESAEPAKSVTSTPISANGDTVKTPENVTQAFFHVLWPTSRAPRIIVVLLLMSVVGAGGIWTTLPDSRKEALLITIFGERRAAQYESDRAYFEFWRSDQPLTGTPTLPAIGSELADQFRNVFGNSQWNSDGHWGTITFDSTGRRANYTNGPGKPPGALYFPVMNGSAPTIHGEWIQVDGQRERIVIVFNSAAPKKSVDVMWRDVSGHEYRDVWKRR